MSSLSNMATQFLMLLASTGSYNSPWFAIPELFSIESDFNVLKLAVEIAMLSLLRFSKSFSKSCMSFSIKNQHTCVVVPSACLPVVHQHMLHGAIAP